MEALAVRWLFPGKKVTIESRCLDCGETVTVQTRDDQLLDVTPSTAVGYQTSPFSRSRIGSHAFN